MAVSHLMILVYFKQVTEEKLIEVLTTRKQVTRGEQFIVPYKYHEVFIMMTVSGAMY